MLFGGEDDFATAFGDTWRWNGTAWSSLQPASSPTPRSGHGLATHAGAGGHVVLFGGRVLGLPTPFAETWTWNGTTWQLRMPLTNPPARHDLSLAYHAGRQRTVLYGGVTGIGTELADTWLWDGNNWAQGPVIGPTARSGAAMAYDDARDRVVLFGGFDGTRYLNDTWEWDGASWTQRQTLVAPPARSSAGMAFDRERCRIVLFGGSIASQPFVLADTWEWTGTRWLNIGPVGPPAARWDGMMAFHSATRAVVLFGGTTSLAVLAGTWAYTPTVRGTSTVFGVGCSGSARIAAVDKPIVGNTNFAVEVSGVLPQASTFLLVSAFRANLFVPPCTIYPQLDIVVGRSASARGDVRFDLPIPFARALSGGLVFAQGVSLDPNGALLGIAVLTPGLQIRIGD